MKVKVIRSRVLLLMCLLISLSLAACSMDRNVSDEEAIENMKADESFEFSDEYKFIDSFNYSNDKCGFYWKKQEYSIKYTYENINFDLLELSSANLFFDSDISLEDRKKFAKENLSLFEYLYGKDDFHDEINVYVTDKFDSAVIEDKVYINNKENLSYEDLLTQILLRKYGEYVNYGLVYGEAVYILQKPNTVEKNIEDANEYLHTLSENSSCVELLYPFFSSKYRTPYQIEEAKALATSISRYIIDEYGYEKFMELTISSAKYDSDFAEKFGTYIKEFSKKLDLTIIYNNNDFAIKCKKMAAGNFDLLLTTEYADFYFENHLNDDVLNVDMQNIDNALNYVREEYASFMNIKENMGISIDANDKAKVYLTDDCFLKSGNLLCEDESAILLVYNPESKVDLSAWITEYFLKEEVYTGDFLRELYAGKGYIVQLYAEKIESDIIYELFDYSISFLGSSNYKYEKGFKNYIASALKKDVEANLFDDVKYRFDYLQLTSYCDLYKSKVKFTSSEQLDRFGILMSSFLIDNYGMQSYKEVYRNSDKIYEITGLNNKKDVEKKVEEYFDEKFGQYIE